MPRSRTVKPELFLDEELGVLSGDHVQLFIGLWTQADREGRLEDRPVRLKAALFPYRTVDVDRLLNDLEAIGKVLRYDADGRRCLFITGFSAHQNPHPKEPASKLPSPPRRVKTRQETACRETPGSIPSRPSDLDPDLDPDLDQSSVTGSAPEPAAAPPPSSSEASPEQTPDALREVWNAEAHPDLPRWIETPPKRAQVAQTRLRERPLDAWRNVIRRINGSPFLRGENERGWRADPDWLLKSGTAAKVLEGKYDPAKNKAKKKQVDEADL